MPSQKYPDRPARPASRQTPPKHTHREAQATALPPDAAPSIADTVLDLAAAVEAQEARIKAALLAAAEAGETAVVRDILKIWINGPVSAAMAQLDAEPCVSDPEHARPE